METAGKDGLKWEGAIWTRAGACAESACLEVAATEDEVALRDSKRPALLPLVVSRSEWAVFLAGARAGDFDAL